MGVVWASVGLGEELPEVVGAPTQAGDQSAS
jgi:hypothetical protein